MGEIISRISIKSLKNSVELPVHEPISFSFEEMVRAKADNALVKQELIDIGKAKTVSENVSDEKISDTARSEYIYDLGAVAELAAIKRKKNDRR